MTLRLSNLARTDLDEIRDYTTSQWGREQWLKYYRGMVGAFEALTQFPERGRDRSLFYPGMRSVNYGEHIIFYMHMGRCDNVTVVLRIVHQRRNLPALLYYDDLDS